MAQTETSRPRTAVVTGGTAGIGKAIAEAFLAEGYRVAVIGRRPGPLAAMRDKGFVAVEGDVSDRSAMELAAKQLPEHFSELDALINAAGVIARQELAKATVETSAAQIATNLMGTVWSCQIFMPALQRAKGAIVNFSSALVSRPSVGTSIYAASKGGVEAFTRALAFEAGPAGVRVNAISPSLVRSEIWTSAGMAPDKYEAMLLERGSQYPLGRTGEGDDVAALASFLVSAQASWLTGTIIPLDGGSSIGLYPPRQT